jgi:hypothetical protein
LAIAESLEGLVSPCWASHFFQALKKVSKNALPLHPAPRFARGSFAPSPLQGSAYKGHQRPYKPFAASLRLNPLRNDSAHPPEGAFGVA